MQPLWGCSDPGAPVAVSPRHATGGHLVGPLLPSRLLSFLLLWWGVPSPSLSASPCCGSPALLSFGVSCGGVVSRRRGLPPRPATGSVWEVFETCLRGLITPVTVPSDGAVNPSGGLVASPHSDRPSSCACSPMPLASRATWPSAATAAAAPSPVSGSAATAVKQAERPSPGPSQAAMALLPAHLASAHSRSPSVLLTACCSRSPRY